MNKAGIDLHAAAGVSGLLASVTLAGYSQLMGAVAATATAAYMVHRAYREWKKK